MCKEKLNLAKLLSGCPKGTKLWSPLFGELDLEFVDNRPVGAPIVLTSSDGSSCRFREDGTYYQGYKDAECLLFPSKEHRDWSKFQSFKDGDILACEDGRAFIFKELTIRDGKAYPIAYGGVETSGTFIKSQGNIWTNSTFRGATAEEVCKMVAKMKEAGYMWDDNQNVLKKDLPVNTLVAVIDGPNSDIHFHSMVIRRYAGEHKCFNNYGGSECYEKTTEWHHIIPLRELTVNKEGIVEIDKVNDYGTRNFYA